jgi:hypothetical protein
MTGYLLFLRALCLSFSSESRSVLKTKTDPGGELHGFSPGIPAKLVMTIIGRQESFRLKTLHYGFQYNRINSTKSVASGADNESELRMIL